MPTERISGPDGSVEFESRRLTAQEVSRVSPLASCFTAINPYDYEYPVAGDLVVMRSPAELGGNVGIVGHWEAKSPTGDVFWYSETAAGGLKMGPTTVVLDGKKATIQALRPETRQKPGTFAKHKDWAGVYKGSDGKLYTVPTFFILRPKFSQLRIR